MSRIPQFLAAALSLVTLGAASTAPAQPLAPVNGFPSQPLRIVSPFPAGGGNDAVTRVVATRLPQVLGQTAVTDNRGGAGGNIGTRFVAESKADGYTVLTSQVSVMAVNPTLYRSPGFDPVKQFVPVTQINAAPLAIVVSANAPWKTFAELATQAKAQPQKITYATPGNGTLSHLVGVVLDKDSSVSLQHVPYKGAGPAINDLLGGQVDVLITSTSSVAGFIQSGRMRALAVTSPRRLGVFAKVPTLEELGYRNARFEDWYGFFVPAGTAPERVALLNRAIVQVLQMPEVVKQINDAGSDVVASSPDVFAAQLRQDISRWSQIVKLSGAHVD
ncbi:Bug family tripartite tricarboxylate transporter substrate binding protein [Cupriavidus consociatus]|uniref:Bug family tripartite tricarboxylate transporter substrate binding protein n=1 Tax=Cupriavidus consociatus TaxID=2821357 RepID=UPI001AE9651F|nr:MULTISPECIES: tripartite tricarboxylate transporter substrate binding protein [unclassified Cupriavidus]MBP0624055.1 tripartite tricarboxylate transporter substrate binding protein [Cupriavidus sp. LEh25]MDK2660765.1 tripartite tricarboxylate transporter substrate binding protein [Cupriavidus sp. LEh21]